jgi:DNA-binding ferritin-like protein (Dps family)
MADDTILCWNWPQALQSLLPSRDPNGHVTVIDCKDWMAEGDAGRTKVAEFFRQRLGERYIEPVARPSLLQKNGFSIMALSCLLIESFETFRQGWESSDSKSALAFCYFFDRETRFHDLNGYARQFYENVRCGILHQGETTGGWTIRLHGPLFESGKLRVNAHEFQKMLSDVIDEYCEELMREPVSTEIWRKFKTKMNATIKNCGA